MKVNYRTEWAKLKYQSPDPDIMKQQKIKTEFCNPLYPPKCKIGLPFWQDYL